MNLFDIKPTRSMALFFVFGPTKRWVDKAKLEVYRKINRGYKIKKELCEQVSIFNYAISNNQGFFVKGRVLLDGKLTYMINPSLVENYFNNFLRDYQTEEYYHFAFISGNKYGIYILYVPGDDNYYYIGKASDQTFRERWEQHRKQLQKGTHHSKRLQNAFNKGKIFIPMIAHWVNDGKLREDEIEDGEKRLIKILYDNSYNVRKW